GPANFAAGVATVRPELILATSIPALILGVRLLAPRAARPGQAAPMKPARTLPAVPLLTDLALLAAAVMVAAGIGARAAAKTSSDAFWGFTAAHLLLAWGFYCVGVLAASLTRRYALPVAVGAWVLFAVLLDDY